MGFTYWQIFAKVTTKDYTYNFFNNIYIISPLPYLPNSYNTVIPSTIHNKEMAVYTYIRAP